MQHMKNSIIPSKSSLICLFSLHVYSSAPVMDNSWDGDERGELDGKKVTVRLK